MDGNYLRELLTQPAATEYLPSTSGNGLSTARSQVTMYYQHQMPRSQVILFPVNDQS